MLESVTSKMAITPGSILDGENGDVKVLQIPVCFTEIDSITILDRHQIRFYDVGFSFSV